MKAIKFGLLFYSLLMSCFIATVWAEGNEQQLNDFSVLYHDSHSELVTDSSNTELRIRGYPNISLSPLTYSEMTVSCYKGVQKMLYLRFIWLSPFLDNNNEEYHLNEECQFFFRVDEDPGHNEQWLYSELRAPYTYMAFPVGPVDWPLYVALKNSSSKHEYFAAEAEYRKWSEKFLSKIKTGQKLTVVIKLKNGLAMHSVFDISGLEERLRTMSNMCN